MTTATAIALVLLICVLLWLFAGLALRVAGLLLVASAPTSATVFWLSAPVVFYGFSASCTSPSAITTSKARWRGTSSPGCRPG